MKIDSHKQFTKNKKIRQLYTTKILMSFSMASLGFRPPQFSEDSAWLPAWLQHHQVEASDEHIKEPQTAPEEAIKDLALLQGNIIEGKDMELLSREEGGFNCCHLYLSGEDNSPSSLVPSPANVLHFNLHLSLDSDSHYTQAQLLYISQAQFESDKVLSVQQVETSAGPGEKTCQSKRMDYNAGGANLLPQNLTPRAAKNVGQQSPTSSKNSGRQYDEKFNVKYLKGADINAAIELSIAASEALVIHELVNSESASEALPTQAVLEIALQVKQARFEKLEDAFHFSTEEIDEIDFLSDLDDLTMADAFEDVGLSFGGPDNQHGCGSEISRVKDTPVSENNYGCDSRFRHVKLRAQQVDFDDSSTQKPSENVLDMDKHLVKDLPKESLNCEWGKKLSDDPALSLNSSSWACHPDPMFHLSTQEHSNVLAMSQYQSVGFAMVDITSFQPRANVHSSSHAWISENAEVENNLTYLVPERFQSRWLGGWTGKEVDASAQMTKNDAKSIPKFFIGETSFLSESADVAPDENSFVQKHGTRSKQVSQSSIPFEGLCDKANVGILLSQDVRSSSLSLIDPLCSVVPCSIASENDGSVDQNQNDREVDARKCFSPTSERGIENLQRNSELNVEFVCGDGQAVPMITGEGSGATVRRQLTSLKSYSMLLPNHDAILERRKLCHTSGCTRGLPALVQNVGCSRSSGKRVSEGFLLFTSVSDCAVGRYNEENHETTCIGNPIAEIVQKRNDETAKDVAELESQPETESRSPLILNHRTRCCLQASKLLVDDSPGDKNPEHAMVAETVVKLQLNKNLQWKQTECNNPHHTQVPVRKRVHFSGLDIQLQQNKDPQELQSSHQYRSIIRASKRSKYSKTSSGSRTQDMKRCFTTCHVKNGKRFIFQGIEFLLTGFSSHKEKEMEGLIRKYGGVVLPDIPSPPNLRGKRSSRSNIQQVPVVLCSKKLQTTKFLYGCAVNAFLLKFKWLTDSITEGSVIPPEKYMILSNQADGKCTRIGKPVPCNNHKCIFEKVGIMLHGKHSFCKKLAIIFRHGGGQVFKTLQWLVQNLDTGKISVGAIVAEDESRASRHLRHCASERKIPVMPGRWIIKSLHSGKLLPFMQQNCPSSLSTIKVPKVPVSMEFSEEI